MLHHHDEDSWLLWLCVAAKSSQCSCQQSVNVLKPLVKLQKVKWYCARSFCNGWGLKHVQKIFVLRGKQGQHEAEWCRRFPVFGKQVIC